MGGLGIEYAMNSPSSRICSQPLSEKVSEMTLDSVSIFKSSIGADTFFTSSWEPPLSLCQNENCGASSTASHCEFSSSPYSTVLDNVGAKTTSDHVHDPSNLNYDMFGNGSISEIVGSFSLAPEGSRSQITNIECPFSYMPNMDAGGSERASTNDSKAQVDCALGSSPNEKRRKLVLGSTSSSLDKTAEGKLNMEPIEDFSDTLKKYDKIPKVEHRICANFHSKSDGKQAKENSQNIQEAKENYIHVRARRGQATNSHSLAERVRREKIGERMKLLQELVPGCNKITGKAVMLDEIINYVQSLQQQVEFLSMKLGNVAPETNLDTEQIMFTDILHSQGMDGVFAMDPRSTISHTAPQTMFQFQCQEHINHFLASLR